MNIAIWIIGGLVIAALILRGFAAVFANAPTWDRSDDNEMFYQAVDREKK